MEIGDCEAVDKAWLKGCSGQRPLAQWQVGFRRAILCSARAFASAFLDEPKASLPQLYVRLMSKLSTDERNLLRYYAETERILHGASRGVIHQHLLGMGYIEERTVNMQDSVIVVTQAGRRALGFRS